jgi:hypothetical protein
MPDESSKSACGDRVSTCCVASPIAVRERADPLDDGLPLEG